jgi:hypothetical protein
MRSAWLNGRVQRLVVHRSTGGLNIDGSNLHSTQPETVVLVPANRGVVHGVFSGISLLRTAHGPRLGARPARLAPSANHPLVLR